MPIVTKPNTFVAVELIDANQMNQNFDTIYSLINGNLDGANLASLALNDTTKFASEVVTQSKTKGVIYTQDLYSQSWVVAGGLATYSGSPANQIQVNTVTANVIQSDGSYRHVLIGGTTYTTSALNTTYYLDLQPDGTMSWNTAHSGQTGYLPLATVTTNGVGNVLVVTDVRMLSAGIAWINLSKVSSSLADLATRSATDLSSGTLPTARLPAYTGDVSSPAGSAVNTITPNIIQDSHVNVAAAIGWSKISKVSSSLADLAVRSATDLTSGTLQVARLPSGIPAVNIGAGLVNDTKFGYLSTTRSDVQVQIDSLVLGNIPDGALTDAKLSNASADIKQRYSKQVPVVYNVKGYGATGNGSDETSVIQAAISAAIAGNSKSVFFPQGTYVATALTGLDQVNLIGDNATLSVGADTANVEQFSGVSALKSKTASVYAKAISEIGIVPINALQKSRQAIKNRNELRVAFFGDSITESGDMVNDEEKYASRVEQEIRNALPSVNVNSFNFALGGRNLYLATSPTYLATATEPTDITTGFYRSWSTVGVSWLDHVKNFRPDVIILAFGMNDASGVGSDYAFSFYLDYFKSLIAAWATVPDVVIVPTFVQSASHGGSVLNQKITQALSRATRYYGIDNGWVVADVNRLYNILINGIEDVTRVGRQELNFQGYPTSWGADTSSFTLSAGVLTPNGGVTNKSVSRDFNFYNGSIEMTFNQPVAGATGNLVVGFRNDATFGSLSVLVTGGAAGTVELRYDGGTIATSGSINIPISTNHTFKLVSNGSSHKIYIDGALALSATSYRKQNEGGITLGGSGTPPVISNLKISALDQVVGTPTYTELDLLGKYNSTDSGNAFNHPNGLGHAMMYLPAFDGFVEELGRVSRDSVVKTTAAITYYVDPSLGNDATNDGLSSGKPLKTITAIISRLPNIIDHAITINAAAGTYTEVVNFLGYYGRGSITLNGAANLAGASSFLIPNILVNNCYLPIVIKGFRATDATQTAFSASSSTNIIFRFCDTVVSATSKYGFFFYNSQGQVDTCNASNRFVAIEVENQSAVTSLTNTGSGNTYGLNSVNASRIGKNGSQPSGTTAEVSSGGGTIG